MPEKEDQSKIKQLIKLLKEEVIAEIKNDLKIKVEAVGGGKIVIELLLTDEIISSDSFFMDIAMPKSPYDDWSFEKIVPYKSTGVYKHTKWGEVIMEQDGSSKKEELPESISEMLKTNPVGVGDLLRQLYKQDSDGK